jgi:cyanophycin synthetase
MLCGMAMQFTEARRLTGPNVYFPRSAAIRLLFEGDDALERAAALLARTAALVRALCAELGWPEPELRSEHKPHSALLACAARWTYTAQTLCEEAAFGALAERDGELFDWDAAREAVRAELQRELPPPRALAALDEAAARGVPAWWPYGEEAGVLQFGYGASGARLHVSELEAGAPVPWERVRRVPIVAITGTNGKTTSTRLLARIARGAGLPAGNTSSDGVVIGDMWVLGGDYTGASGAARVLSDPYVQVAVLETARGGMLRTGLGFDYPDVALLTNVTPDHLGQFGVESVDEMAQVKGLLLELLPPSGRAVLNARDPRLVAQAARSRAPVIYFSLDEQHPVLQAHRANGGEAAFRRGDTLWFARGVDETPVIDVGEIPIAYGGAATHNVENALGVIAAAHAMGWPREAIYGGLHDFWPTLEENPGRLNSVEVRGVRVVLDFAHNPDGVRALMQFGRNLNPARLLVVMGAHGDRTNAMIAAEAREVARGAAGVIIKEDARALRGRQPGEVPALLQAALIEAGLAPNDMLVVGDERTAVAEAMRVAQPGDAVLVMCHEDRHGIMEWLRGMG